MRKLDEVDLSLLTLLIASIVFIVSIIFPNSSEASTTYNPKFGVGIAEESLLEMEKYITSTTYVTWREIKNKDNCGKQLGSLYGCILPKDGAFHIFIRTDISEEDQHLVYLHELQHMYRYVVLGYTWEAARFHRHWYPLS